MCATAAHTHHTLCVHGTAVKYSAPDGKADSGQHTATPQVPERSAKRRVTGASIASAPPLCWNRHVSASQACRTAAVRGDATDRTPPLWHVCCAHAEAYVCMSRSRARPRLSQPTSTLLPLPAAGSALYQPEPPKKKTSPVQRPHRCCRANLLRCNRGARVAEHRRQSVPSTTGGPTQRWAWDARGKTGMWPRSALAGSAAGHAQA